MTSSAGDILAEYGRRQSAYEELAREVERLLKKLTSDASIGCHSITSRVKDASSLEKKVSRPGKSYSKLDDITDLAGIRVITFFSDDVDKIALLIDREFQVDTKRSIDKRVKDPTVFGYSSLHKVCSLSRERAVLAEFRRVSGLLCEIQVRSILQHAWAEIEHDLGYKSAEAVPAPERRRFSRLAAVLDMADEELVTLRDRLDAYVRQAEQTVEASEALEIDNDSVAAFIKRDPIIRSIDEAIASSLGLDLAASTRADIEARVRDLRLLRISRTTELARTLEQHKDAIVAVAVALSKAKRRRQHAHVGQGAAISWLGLATAALLEDSAATAGLLHQLRIPDPDQSVTTLVRSAVQRPRPVAVTQSNGRQRSARQQHRQRRQRA